MNKIHEKSLCCRARIRRFGGRRRQCAVCKKTWRAWRRKRGRNRLRISTFLAHQFARERLLPTRASQNRRSGSRNKQQYRLAQSRDRCVSMCPWPVQPPTCPLITVADAIVLFLQGRWHTWYIITVRPVAENIATALPPYHKEGTETVSGWINAFATVNANVRNRIVALVGDGHTGLVREARLRGWIMQRCHFHLIARIQGRCSKWKTGRRAEEGRRIYQLTKCILTDLERTRVQSALDELETIGWTHRSPELRKVIAGFVNHYRDYRTYLAHPALRLPTTNNTVESLNSILERVRKQANGFRSLKATHAWFIVTLKTRGRIACNPKNQPN